MYWISVLNWKHDWTTRDELEYINDDALIERMNDLISKVQEQCRSMGKFKRSIYGAKVALIGEVNAGKSSLFNQLWAWNELLCSISEQPEILLKSLYILMVWKFVFDTCLERTFR